MVSKRILAAVLGLGLIAALAAGVFLTTATASAAAVAPASGSVTQVAGKITAIAGSNLTVQGARQHNYTVTVGANTWIVVKQNNKPAQGSLSDLKVGDNVRVAGTVTGTDQISARVVTDGVAAGRIGARVAQRPRARLALGQTETVQSVSNGTVTLRAGRNARTVTLNTDVGTVVIKNGLAVVGDLKVGDGVRVIPRRPAQAAGATPSTTTPTRTAALIYVPASDHVLLTATVKSVSGNTLTFSGRAARTVTVDANTKYEQVNGAGQAPTAAGLSAIQAGTRIVLYGPKPASGQTGTASLVLIWPATTK